jgi:hypothetical protein
MVVEICQPKESLQLLTCIRSWIILYCCHTVWKLLNTLGSDIGQGTWLQDFKLALLLIDDQACCLEVEENFLYISLVMIHRLAGQNNVIQVDKDDRKSGQQPGLSLAGRYFLHFLDQKKDAGTLRG